MAISTAAAIVGAGVLGAGASLLGASKGASAATNAAQLQTGAANRAADLQWDQFNINRNDLAPFRQLGLGAMSQLSSLLPGGIRTGQGAGAGASPGAGPATINPDGTPVPAAEDLSSLLGPGAGGDSDFLNRLLGSLPGAPGNALSAQLRGFLPGENQNALVDQLEAWTRGDKNPVVSGLMGFMSGAHMADPSVAALNQFIPGGTYDGPVAGSLEGVNRLLGLDGKTGQMGAGGPDAAGIQSFLESTPGYQFTLDQGLKATQNSFTSKGLGNSGAALKGAASFASGLADQTYSNRLNEYLNTYNSQFTNTLNNYNNRFSNQLNTVNTQFANNLNLVGQGATNTFNAAEQQFNQNSTTYQNQFNNALNTIAVGQGATNQGAQLGAQTASNVGNYLVGGANAAASGIVGASNAITGGATNVANSVSQSLLLSALMGNQSNALSPGGTPGLNGFSAGTSGKGIYTQ